MWRFIKKWWFLQNLRNAITFHTSQQSMEKLHGGGKVLLTQDFFIIGTDAYPGLAIRSVKRFYPILWWRRGGQDEKKIKKRVIEYNEIFEVCVKEGYINMQPTEGSVPMPSTATPLADSICGWWGLLQNILKKYYLAWSVIVIPFLIGIFSSPFFKNIIKIFE